MNMSLVLRLPRKMHLYGSSSNVPRLPTLLEMSQNPYVLFTFGKVQNPLRLPRKTTSEPSKVVRACGDFNILTWKCALRHNGVHFSNISTSKSGPNMVCFVHFDLEMCFAPQLRAISHLSSGQLASNLPLSYLLAHLYLLSSFFFLLLFSSLLFSSLVLSCLVFSSLLFSSLTLPISAFHLSILWEV